MRVICHIGHHKTGTSSLQTFLSQNSYQLLKHGIYYPWTESQGASYALKKAMSGKDTKEIPSWNIREAHNALAFRMMTDNVKDWRVPSFHPNIPHSNQILVSLHNQLEAVQPDVSVICSEVMSNFGRLAPNLINRLRKALRLADDFTLWCTLRRPDEQVVAWHGQAIRAGETPVKLQNLKHGVNYNGIHFNYLDVVRPWISRIQDCKIILRPYREVLQQGGSVEDFFAELPVQSDCLIPVEKMNESIAPGALAVIRDVNAKLGQGHSEPIRQKLIDLSCNMSLLSSKQVELLGQEQRQVMFEKFKPIHQWLSDTSGRDMFFTDIEEMLECKPISEDEAKRQFLDLLTDEVIKQLWSEEGRRVLTSLKYG
ncbi:hypothetical protein SAMN04488056_108193 [Cohaesibacter marisflavi]|uniref:Sulfotransferase family protein n=1 Tax=Cohaesibacter marisflavi TaxID=655353 RepID=A0A1I5ICT4_9HYPH|nr:hypothetical protein [Cohaesibacter marisflavi]SFO58417.1 hypothetical protein SAMN04488056_108193 [Cohaesibacter marisflavi]